MFLVDARRCARYVRDALRTPEVSDLLCLLIPDRKKEVYDHSIRVALITCQFCLNHSSNEKGYRIPWSGYYLRTAVVSALLHDIGKLYVPTEILDRKAPLTPEEFERHIKPHPENSARLTGFMEAIGLPLVSRIVRGHHNWKSRGEGYPDPSPRPISQLDPCSEEWVASWIQQYICVADICDARAMRADRKGTESDVDLSIWLTGTFSGEAELVPFALSTQIPFF